MQSLAEPGTVISAVGSALGRKPPPGVQGVGDAQPRPWGWGHGRRLCNPAWA